MCGIAGIKRLGKEPINPLQIQALLLGIEHRGWDATGVAFQYRDGNLMVYKEDVQAWRFTTSESYKNFLKDHLNDDVMQVIMHTRSATKGDPKLLKNDHPMYAGKAAIVHNGGVRNDNFLFDDFKLKREADTDSDIFRAIVDKWGFTKEAIRKMERCSGSAAVACLHPEYPGKLLLVRSGNPIQIGVTDDFMMFASTKHAIHKAIRPWVKRLGIWFQQNAPNTAYSPMADDTAWIFGDELEWHDKCKIYYGGVTYCGGKIIKVGRGKDYQRNWHKDDKVSKYAWCVKCGAKYVFGKKDFNKPLSNFKCSDSKCGGELTSVSPSNVN